MKESEFQRIIRKSGSKPISCKCKLCQKQCTTAPCLGTPADIEKIIDAGYADKIYPTTWLVGILVGAINQPIEMYQAEFVNNEFCAFFENGLCQLHDKGLKPTEGKLSHHTRQSNKFGKSIAWQVAKEWINSENAEIIERIKQKLNEY